MLILPQACWCPSCGLGTQSNRVGGHHGDVQRQSSQALSMPFMKNPNALKAGATPRTAGAEQRGTLKSRFLRVQVHHFGGNVGSN